MITKIQAHSSQADRRKLRGQMLRQRSSGQLHVRPLLAARDLIIEGTVNMAK